MRVLYLNLDRDLVGAPDFLRAECYEVLEVTSFRDALKVIAVHDVDAVLVDDNANPEIVDFMADVRDVRPYLPVFIVSAWGPDLALALRCLAAAAHAGVA